MFEYINPGAVILSGIILFLYIGIYILSLEKKQTKQKGRKSNKFPLFIIVMVLAAPLLLSSYTKSNILENLKVFNYAKSLKCSNFSNSYIVSKESGWEISEDSFLKDSLLIRADKCDQI